MDKFNDFFVNIADKIPFGKDFFKNSLPVFGIEINNLFLILVSLLLVIVAIVLIIAIVVSSKKAKKAKAIASQATEGEADAQSSAGSTACGVLMDKQPKCAAITADIADTGKPEAAASKDSSDTVGKPQAESVLSDVQEEIDTVDSTAQAAASSAVESGAIHADKLPEEKTQSELSKPEAAAVEAETPTLVQENKDDLSKLAAASVSEAAPPTRTAPKTTATPIADGAKKPLKKAEPVAVAEPAKSSEPKDTKATTAAAPKKSDNAVGKKSADRYSGKFEIYLTVCGYRFILTASNGQLLYESNGYTSADGALKGIETFKNAVPNGTFVVDEDKFNRFRYILNKRYVGENYTTKASCENSIESVKKFSQTAIVMPYVADEAAEQAYAESMKMRKAQKEIDWEEIEKAEKLVKPSGKFEITKGADGFHFNLIANNGQLLYASNGYASNKSVNEGIKNFKKTVYSGTFFVDEDKFGRFRYILRGATFNSIYIGESYTARAACEKIIQSVKRFVKSAVMPE